ncbi:uncharacterized protein F4807DRAFT_459469 [Annulohypoxylon truncatum]|uniref:uncharacterized protein n=1 Tax=Annulohypoxylon truncatum TaxID=327061 RepID=UPI0020082B4A|nr:uncharacterized protein F4807DRAFT_459469 [Annulohypoxylon truncatum]KAI1210628.1 hypothetical protein F4807DRAFT_459469 [Annulohypoxylon truncatum]
MSTYTRPQYAPYTTPGVYTERIPWHQRPTSAHHRPLGSFADARPYTPPHLDFVNLRREAEHAREEARKDAEWLEWQGRIATTGGPPTPSSAGTDGDGYGDRDAWGKTSLYGAACDLFYGIRLVLFAWMVVLTDAHKHYSVVFDRWYWLRLTAYRQSQWPLVLRCVRYWMTVLLCVVVAAFVAKLNIDEYLASESEPAIVYRTPPEYHVWSVTAPRCAPDCCNRSKATWVHGLEN